MEKLFTINNIDFYNINTTVLYTSSYNYLKDAPNFIYNNACIIDNKTKTSIKDIPLDLLKEFSCTSLLSQQNLTKTDELKINILKSLNSNYQIYVFINTLTYLDNEFKTQVINYLKTNHKTIINYTMDIEETLLLEYIIVIHNSNVIMEGKKEDILTQEKILKKLGLNLPFIVELSIGLKYYGLINQIYYDNESLVQALWN